MQPHDRRRQLHLLDLAVGRDAVALCVVGGPGDLEQLARPADVAVCDLLRLDERVHRHRVSFAKKAVARFKMSTSSCSRRFSRRNRWSSARSSLLTPSAR